MNTPPPLLIGIVSPEFLVSPELPEFVVSPEFDIDQEPFDRWIVYGLEKILHFGD